MRANINMVLFLLALSAAPCAIAACGDDDDAAHEHDDSSGGSSGGNKDGGAKPTPSNDAGSVGKDAGEGHADAGEPDCYEHPKTHLQIINACTDADFVDKEPELPLLLADGGLPPLP